MGPVTNIKNIHIDKVKYSLDFFHKKHFSNIYFCIYA